MRGHRSLHRQSGGRRDHHDTDGRAGLQRPQRRSGARRSRDGSAAVSCGSRQPRDRANPDGRARRHRLRRRRAAAPACRTSKLRPRGGDVRQPARGTGRESVPHLAAAYGDARFQSQADVQARGGGRTGMRCLLGGPPRRLGRAARLAVAGSRAGRKTRPGWSTSRRTFASAPRRSTKRSTSTRTVLRRAWRSSPVPCRSTCASSTTTARGASGLLCHRGAARERAASAPRAHAARVVRQRDHRQHRRRTQARGGHPSSVAAQRSLCYNALSHRHAPEIAACARAATGVEAEFAFVPHSGPFARGIHVTVQAPLRPDRHSAGAGGAARVLPRSALRTGDATPPRGSRKSPRPTTPTCPRSRTAAPSR